MTLILVYFVVTIIAFIFIIGFLLPVKAKVSETQFAAAFPQTVFNQVADFHNFVTWNEWSKKDINMKQTFEGMPKTVGSTYSWKGNKNVGEGSMQITYIEDNKKVEMDLDFGRQGTAKCGFLLEPKAAGTSVTWYFEADMGNSPVKRIVGKVMQKFIANDYKKGLNNLVEKLALMDEDSDEA